MNARGGDTETRLLQAAKKLFAQQGFAGVTVREIANAAQVHFGLIRYHYGDKTGLYRACIQRYGQARLLSAKRFLVKPSSREDFIQKLKYVLEDIVDIQLADPYLTRLVLREAESENSIADDIFKDTLIEMAKCFVAYFSAAQQSGYMREDADPQFITHMIQGTINHFVRTDSIRSRHFNHSLKTPNVKQNMVNQLHTLVLHGTLIEEERPL